MLTAPTMADMTDVLAAMRIQRRIVVCDECDAEIRVMDQAKVPLSHPEEVEYGGELCEDCGGYEDEYDDE